jgi:nucleoside diphosphate kinase
MSGLPTPRRWPRKYLAKALLGYVMDTRLAGAPAAAEVCMPAPWDAWWACYRAALPLGKLGIAVGLPDGTCPACERDAFEMAAADPPRHPRLDRPRPCGCLLEWAVRMRAPAAAVSWPPVSLSLALLKPSAPRRQIRERLATAYEVLGSFPLTLTTRDTRRLYPEAYGASYVAARDTYLTRAPVLVLVLRARTLHAPTAGKVKAQIRGEFGGDMLHNHVHMPDNPGEALADIAHFACEQTLAELYGRYERERSADRVAFYRAALGIRQTGAHRDRAAR